MRITKDPKKGYLAIKNRVWKNLRFILFNTGYRVFSQIGLGGGGIKLFFLKL
jgi:hypothetical protein